jgi:hypothetical protein
MPKRPKPKMKTTTTNERTVSVAKQARIIKQLEQTNDNKTRLRQGGIKPWDVIKQARHDRRKARGLTYDNWRKKNSARYDDNAPTASNTLTEPVRGGRYKVKERDPYDARESYGLH